MMLTLSPLFSGKYLLAYGVSYDLSTVFARGRSNENSIAGRWIEFKLSERHGNYSPMGLLCDQMQS